MQEERGRFLCLDPSQNRAAGVDTDWLCRQYGASFEQIIFHLPPP